MPQDFLAYAHRVIVHYWLWVGLGNLNRILSLLGFGIPPLKRWLERNPIMANRRVAFAILLVGFVYANFMAFHDAKVETRIIQQDFEQYRQAMTIAPSPITKTLALHELDDPGSSWGKTPQPERTNITQTHRLTGQAFKKRERRNLSLAISHEELGVWLHEPVLTVVVPNTVVQSEDMPTWIVQPEDEERTRYITNQFLNGGIPGHGLPVPTQWVLPLIFPTSPADYSCAYRIRGLDNHGRKVETESIPFTIHLD